MVSLTAAEFLFPNSFSGALQGNILDTAKAQKFPIPLLTVAHQQLIAGIVHIPSFFSFVEDNSIIQM